MLGVVCDYDLSVWQIALLFLARNKTALARILRVSYMHSASCRVFVFRSIYSKPKKIEFQKGSPSSPSQDTKNGSRLALPSEQYVFGILPCICVCYSSLRV
jgi:hypothetical protein